LEGEEWRKIVKSNFAQSHNTLRDRGIVLEEAESNEDFVEGRITKNYWDIFDCDSPVPRRRTAGRQDPQWSKNYGAESSWDHLSRSAPQNKPTPQTAYLD
jgi:hypothetical protein